MAQLWNEPFLIEFWRREHTPTHDCNDVENKPWQKKSSLLNLDGQHKECIDQDANGGKDAKNDDNEQIQFTLLLVMPAAAAVLIFFLTVLLVTIRSSD